MCRIVLLAALALAGCGPVNIVLPNGAVNVPSIAPTITLTTPNAPSAPGASDPNAPPPPPPTHWNLPGNTVDGGGGLGGLR